MHFLPLPPATGAEPRLRADLATLPFVEFASVTLCVNASDNNASLLRFQAAGAIQRGDRHPVACAAAPIAVLMRCTADTSTPKARGLHDASPRRQQRAYARFLVSCIVGVPAACPALWRAPGRH
jgi:hypothetical protein